MSPHSFAANLREWAQRRPDGPAVTGGAAGEPDVTLTYGGLDAASNAVAQALAALGVRPGGRVAHLGRNRITYPFVLYAASKLRATVIGLNWRFHAGELAPLLADARPDVIVTDEEFAPAARQASRASGVATSIATDVEVLTWSNNDGAADPGHRPHQDDVALIFYTSGTTGAPKGAMLSVAAVSNHLARPTPWRMDTTSNVLVCSPMFHTAGTGWLYLPAFRGAHCVMLRDPAPDEIVGRLTAHRITEALLVPTVIRMLLDVPALRSADLSPLRTIVYGASPISSTVLERAVDAFGCEFVQAYGMTETGGPICYLEPADHDTTRANPRLRSAGRPIPGVEVRVTDPDTARPCAPCEFGEVWTRSDQQMDGYLNRPVDSAAAITREGWLRTGDGGYVDADGYIYLTDRLSDVIVTGGENVYPLEVENVLAAHPAVAEVAVIGVPDDRWGETVVAVVVPSGDVTAAELIAHARQRLAHYKAPTRVEFAPELPKNPAGKVVRRLLRLERATPPAGAVGG